MSTKKALSEDPGAEEGEFDVRFGEGELGMRLEERGSFKASSVVVKITEDGEEQEGRMDLTCVCEVDVMDEHPVGRPEFWWRGGRD